MRALMVLVVAAACGAKEPVAETEPSGSAPPPAADAAPTTPRLFGDAEIARYEAQLVDRLAANAKRTCSRPVVRGVAKAGSARAEMVELFELSGPLETCKQMLDPDTVQDLIAGKRSTAVRGFDRTCGELLATRVERAIAHSDACSPYQVGVRGMRTYETVLWLARALGTHAELVAADGESARAVWSIVMALQLFQDLGRGQVGAITSAIATAGSDILINHAHAILDQARLGANEARAMATAVDALLATAPPLAHTIWGELASMELYMASAPTKPATWTPPGGWDESMRDLPLSSDTSIDPRDQAALMFVTVELVVGKLETACPERANLATCHRKLTEVAKASRETDQQDVRAMQAQIVKAALAGDDLSQVAVRERVRHRIGALLADLTIARLAGDLASRQGRSIVHLAELRIHLELLHHLAIKHRCPVAAELADTPFHQLARPASLGDTLSLALSQNRVSVEAPAWISKSKPRMIACGN